MTYKTERLNTSMLREKAEELLKVKKSDSKKVLSENEMLKLIHELEVHQIELEMQNDELLIAKKNIELAELKYTELYNFATSGYLSLSATGFILDLNYTAAKMLGKERSNLINNLFAFFVSEDMLQIFNEFFCTVFQSKSITKCEVVLVTKNSLSIYVNLDGKCSENGEQCEITLTDITERKLAELALVQSEERFKGAFEAAAHGIALIDTNGKFIQINQPFCDIVGYTKTEMLTSDFQNFTHPDDIEVDIKYINQLLSNEIQCYHLEKRYFHKNGEFIWVILSVTLIRDENNIPVHFVTQVIDITKRKKIEQELQQHTKELSQLNIDKDRFITILAHDLKSPFNSLIGLSDLLVKNFREYDTNKIDKFVNQINNSAKNTYKLLEDILTWIKAQAGKITFTPEKLNFSNICQNIIESLKQSATDKNIIINYFASEEINMFADKYMLLMILRNLVSNAIKFTNIGGQINIYAEINQTNAIITVSDNGIGIGHDILNNIFEINALRSTEGTAHEQGTGFGLLLCKDFVEKHGGKIWVESEVGKGSEFKFTIPLFDEKKV